MKTIYSPMLLVLVFTSCNTEEPAPAFRPYQKNLVSKPILTNPAINANNPFDHAGVLYVELTSTYLADEAAYSQLQLASCYNICNANQAFLALLTTNYLYTSQTTLSPYFNGTLTQLQTSIDASGMSYAAKTSLLEFILEVEAKKFQNVGSEILLSYMFSYENGISAGNFSAVEKKTILIVSSIIRHGNYLSVTLKKQKPRDRNWDITMGITAAVVDGVTQSLAKAVENAFVVGVCVNAL